VETLDVRGYAITFGKVTPKGVFTLEGHKLKGGSGSVVYTIPLRRPVRVTLHAGRHVVRETFPAHSNLVIVAKLSAVSALNHLAFAELRVPSSA